MPDAMAQTPPKTPKYFARSRMLKRSETQILQRMTSPPPPMPCTTRPAISILTLWAKAEISDPIIKMKFATRMIGFRPQMSLILPQSGTDDAHASR